MNVADRTSAEVAAPSGRRRPIWARTLAWVGIAAFLLFAAAFTTFAIYFQRAEPIFRQRVINTLATRYDSRVELDTFQVSAMRGFEIIGGGLKLYPNQLDVDKPLIAVNKFAFRASWHDLLHSPMHIHTLRVSGLDINMPPRHQRPSIPNFNPGSADIGASQHAKIEIIVDHIEIDHANLVLGTDKPGKYPLVFQISNVQLTSVAAGQPLRFHAILINPKPIGNIDSTGTFGPFNEHSPGDSPVSGVYSFTHADLNSIKGIGGMLSSTGKYVGTLNNINVDGETDTPNFSLDTANHPMPLHTKFHAVVDGMNGDTHLDPVDATLLHSHIIAIGDVINIPGQGHNIVLDVTVQPGRIEDMLELGVKTLPPIMTGALTFHTALSIPPGPQPVTEKLRLKGNFRITDALFTSRGVQDKINELSLRSQGHAGEAKNPDHNMPDIPTNLEDNFVLANDKLTITNLKFKVPGANIAMNGVYTLDGNEVDFHGTARLQAHVSQMVTGWKSILLKPVDPFFAKNGAGTEVPVSITGTRSDLHFGLDFHHNDNNSNKHEIHHGNRIP